MTKLTQLQLDNEKLREALLQASRQLDLYEPSSTMCKIVSEALSITSQPESVVLNNQTAQKPLSDEELLIILKSVAIGASRVPQGYKMFARAIEKRIRTGE